MFGRTEDARARRRRAAAGLAAPFIGLCALANRQASDHDGERHPVQKENSTERDMPGQRQRNRHHENAEADNDESLPTRKGFTHEGVIGRRRRYYGPSGKRLRGAA